MRYRDPQDIQRIAELEAQVAELKELLAQALARIAVLEERLNKNSSNSSKPPSSDGPEMARAVKEPSGRKPGGQPGHGKHERTFLEPNHVVPVMPRFCRCCGKAVRVSELPPDRHQVMEMPKVVPEVIDYQLYFGNCEHCGAVTLAELPPGVPRRGYGPRLTALISLLSGEYRLSKRRIQSILSDMLGVKLSLGSVSNLEQEMSASLAASVEEVAAHVKAQDVVNADETGWFEGRSKGRAGRAWLWLVTTKAATLFRVARSRGADVARELLGSDFAGLLGTDRWGAYNFVDPARRQLCWSHLKRDFQGFVDRQDAGAPLGKSLLSHFDKMFRYWHRVRDGTLARTAFQHRMRPVRSRILSLLREASVCSARKTAGMAKKILRLEAALFTFVDHEGMEPTNNISERKIRPSVMWRKTSFGTHSTHGSRFVERILTAAATLRQQNRDVLNFLTEAYQARLFHRIAPSLLSATQR
jgi:transposase